MPKRRDSRRRATTGPPLPVRRQVSAGGVAYRRGAGDVVEVALIRPRGTRRWQLPKGLVDPGEAPETTARREVREEAGVDGEVVAPVDEVQYWYVGDDRDGVRVRFHKSVHFFLIAFTAGDVRDHDHEVEETRWAPIDEAVGLLAFTNEKAVLEKAVTLIGQDGRRTR